MIIKASQRGGARALARHLLNDRDNDWVRVHSVRGFLARDLSGALLETEAIAKATQCRQFLFSVSLNPPKGATVSDDDFVSAAEVIETSLGLAGQPRTLVHHCKNGRLHAHVVWTRLDPARLRAVNLPFFKTKLMAVARDLYRRHGWDMPGGLRPDGKADPANYGLAEAQQAKRLERDPKAMKQIFREAWERSDSAAGFGAALLDQGYQLAHGDRRGFVAVDAEGNVFAVARLAGVPTRDVRARLGTGAALPPVASLIPVPAPKQAVEQPKTGSLVPEPTMSPPQPVEAPTVPMVPAPTVRCQADPLARLITEHRREWKRLAERRERERHDITLAYAPRGTGFWWMLWDRITGIARRREKALDQAIQRALDRERQERRVLWLRQQSERHSLARDGHPMTVRNPQMQKPRSEQWQRSEPRHRRRPNAPAQAPP